MCKSFVLLIILLVSSQGVYGRVNNMERPGNRFLVAQKLLKIFGNSKKNIEQLERYIYSRVSLFGGPCDEYSDLYKESGDGPVINDKLDQCYSNRLNQFYTSIGRTGFQREISVRVACELLSNKENSKNILKKNNDRFDIKYIFNQFYPYKEFRKEMVSSFLDDINGYDELSKVQKSLEMFCKTSLWQYI